MLPGSIITFNFSLGNRIPQDEVCNKIPDLIFPKVEKEWHISSIWKNYYWLIESNNESQLSEARGDVFPSKRKPAYYMKAFLVEHDTVCQTIIWNSGHCIGR